MKLLATVPLRSTGWIRWIARIVGLLIALLVLTWNTAGAVDLIRGASWQLTEFLEGVVLLCIGASMVLAWRWEKLGGLLCVLEGVALGIVILLTADVNKIRGFLTLTPPLIVVGAAFLAANRGVGIAHRESGA